MKRALIASILGIMASAASSYGDGQVIFSNYLSVPNNLVAYGAGVIGHASGSLVDDPMVEVQLYYAIGTYTSKSSFLSAATAGNTTFINPSLLGDGEYFDGVISGPFGQFGYAHPTVQLITGWNGQVNGVYTLGSNPVTFMVEAWETAGPQGGATYSQALVSGQSSLWTEVAEGPVYQPPDGGPSFGVDPLGADLLPMANGPTAVTIQLVPEPTTLALFGFGAAGLLAVRFRKF